MTKIESERTPEGVLSAYYCRELLSKTVTAFDLPFALPRSSLLTAIPHGD